MRAAIADGSIRIHSDPMSRLAVGAIDALLLAFASQQAPEGWTLVPEVCSERWLFWAKKRLGADPDEARTIWSAMLDAAPSVTLGEVG